MKYEVRNTGLEITSNAERRLLNEEVENIQLPESHTWYFVLRTTYLILMSKQYPIQKSEEEWQEQLDPLSYQVLRQKGTERPFTGAYTLNKETGVYSCKGCGSPIFHSDFKYDSGCGWPSFTHPIRPEAIDVHMDYSHFMIREEILCASCGGHLGHRFPDGPSDKGGIRYCINSVSMEFEK
jgi:peptide-methionine (R)-S-oxide reductase